MNNFHCALITGASSGIGEALALLLHKRGIPLILTGRDEKRLYEVAQKTQALEALIADLSIPEHRALLANVIREKKPDLLINNAGFGVYGIAAQQPIDEQLKILEVNGAAPLELTLVAAHTLMEAKRKGVIVNVSSVAGEHPSPGMSVYGASKAFLTHLSQSLHAELSPYDIAVLVSCPGMVATHFADRAAKRSVTIDKGIILSSEFAAEQIWKQITKKREKHIFNWQYRLGSLIAKMVIPTSFIKKVIWKRIKKRL